MKDKNFKMNLTGNATADFLSIGTPATSDSSPAENPKVAPVQQTTEPEKKAAARKKTTAKKAAGKSKKEETTETAPTTLTAQGIPAGYVLKKEPKSDRLQVLIAPSIKAELKNKAKADSISVNELVNRLIEKGLHES